MRKVFFILIIVELGSLASCAASLSLEELIAQDVLYGSDSLQVMDVYLKEGRTTDTPLVVLIHGGGWMAGDKKDADFMKDACFNNGINVVNINYRLGSSTVHYQEMMSDIGLAMQYVLDHADEWNIRKSKFIFWGGSAGAHLALLYAYNYDINNLVSLIITLGAPIKFDDPKALTGAKPSDVVGLLPIITGKPWTNDSGSLDIAYKEASPYYGKNLKPTFLIHGEADNIVPLQQSVMMSELLKQSNVCDTLVILPHGGHGGENTPPEISSKVNEVMYRWILKYSNNLN